EENAEQTLAEAITHPVFERLFVRVRAQTSPRIGCDASRRFDHAEFRQRFERFQRITEECAVVVNPRRAWAVEQVTAQDFSPKVLPLFRFGKKAVAADVEVKTLVPDRSGNTPDVFRVRLKNPNRETLFR